MRLAFFGTPDFAVPALHALVALVPEAESPTEVRSRVIKLLSRLEAQHVCLVTHGVVLQILLTHLLGKPLDRFPRFSFPNASLYLVQPGQELEFLQI